MSKKVFGVDFAEIQNKWKFHLKKKYFPLINEFNLPTETFERLTDHKKDGSFINCAPRFSPSENSDEFLYFSNKKLKTDIWKASVLEEVEKPKKILSGEMTGKFEEFHFQRNNLSWFQDGKRFAFASKATTGDKIYVMNLKNRKIEKAFSFPGFDAIYEIDVSHDGKKIAFSGQKNFQDNIYIFEIDSGKIIPITSDRFFDSQPRWSQNDEKIVFTSERDLRKKNPGTEHIFGDLSSDIFYYDLNEKQFYQVTNDDFNNDSPFWDSAGKEIIFISERDSVRNFEIINTEKGRRAQLTKTLSGVFNGDIDGNNEYLVFSCFL